MDTAEKQKALRDFVHNLVWANITGVMTKYILPHEPEIITEQFLKNVREHKEEEETEDEEEEPEIFEFYIVDKILWRKLKNKGEPVGEVGGVDVWGRTCTGQAIYLDGVIEEIYDEIQGRE